MSDLITRVDGKAGCLTLNRPHALNALTYDMILGIEAALLNWRDDPAVALVMLDATGDRAFCAGGDIADMYASAQNGDLEYGRKFWRDEYRLNALIHDYPKPIVAFLQGFTMGGGVGVGCHAAHRILCETSQISLPEVAIGLVPDVGGSYLLAKAPGHVGTYLGLTGDRMDAADALFAGFADAYVPQSKWSGLKAALIRSGDPDIIHSEPCGDSRLGRWQPAIDAAFDHETLAMFGWDLDGNKAEPLAHAHNLMMRNSPLAMACAIKIIAAVRRSPDMHFALAQEYNFTHRAVEKSDFIEGIRAAYGRHHNDSTTCA